MAGHSKWANIKHRKNSQDTKKSKIFTKLIKEITVSTRLFGDDVESNPRLRKAVSVAKSNNIPFEKIDRAIKKGSGDLEGVSYYQCTYEGYGPGGVAIIIEVITDNKNRTVSELRNIFTKNNGNLAENGSVSWIFDKKGEIIAERRNKSENSLFNLAVEIGADDILIKADLFSLITKPADLMEVSELVQNKGYSIKSSEINMIPKTMQKVKKKEYELLIKLLDHLEKNDDINKVFSNLDWEKLQ